VQLISEYLYTNNTAGLNFIQDSPADVTLNYYCALFESLGKLDSITLVVKGEMWTGDIWSCGSTHFKEAT
jgi:hypothetical protein